MAENEEFLCETPGRTGPTRPSFVRQSVKFVHYAHCGIWDDAASFGAFLVPPVLFPSATLTTGRPSLATRHYSEPLLFGRSRVNLAALRTVKVAPGPQIRPSRKTCTIRISGGLTSTCRKNTHPARRQPAWAARGPLLALNYRRPSARSRHTECTTRLPES
jgi:hypothetical protein